MAAWILRGKSSRRE